MRLLVDTKCMLIVKQITQYITRWNHQPNVNSMEKFQTLIMTKKVGIFLNFEDLVRSLGSLQLVY